MLKLLIALSLLTTVVAAACGGGGGGLVKNADGLYVIERYDFKGVDLELGDLVEPRLPNPYPEVVARVNAEEIMGEELLVKEILLELGRCDIADVGEILREQLLADSDSTDPLNSLIDYSLMKQAVERLSLLPSQEEAIEYTRQMEQTFLHSAGAAGLEGAVELLRLQGFPAEDWAANDELVERYSETLGLLALRQQECSPSPTQPPPDSFISFGSDCAAFLAAERENVDIEYFVVWAE